MFSNNHFQFLNNISHIFIHFFTHTYFYKNFQFLHKYSLRIIHCSHQPLILCQETECPFQDYSRMLLNNKMTFFFLNWRGKQTDPFQIQILNPTRFQIKLQSDFGFTNARERESDWTDPRPSRRDAASLRWRRWHPASRRSHSLAVPSSSHLRYYTFFLWLCNPVIYIVCTL